MNMTLSRASGSAPRILAIVLAGGEGTRLHPLTADRSKPAVPIYGRYRVVDFVLSNLVNSGINAIYLLVQYKAQSLIEHVRKAWQLSPVIPTQFVTVVPPQMREGPEWFRGTADAVLQNLTLIDQHQPDLVAVFGADHVYRMDVQQMVRFHLERGADVTVAALPVPREEASAFGIIDADEDGRIRKFLEKPASPPPMPQRPTHAYASMGNYLFSTRVLVKALHTKRGDAESDFGRHVLPWLITVRRAYAYDLSANAVPGVRATEEAAYWRDVGAIGAYFQATQDALGPNPRFNLFNPQWPVYSGNYQGPDANVIGGSIQHSVMAGGTIVNGARIRNCVLRSEVLLEEDASLDECIVMDYVTIGRGCRLRRTIVDSYNTLPERTVIGYDAAADRARYHVDEASGIVVVPQGPRSYATDSYFEGEW